MDKKGSISSKARKHLNIPDSNDEIQDQSALKQSQSLKERKERGTSLSQSITSRDNIITRGGNKFLVKTEIFGPKHLRDAVANNPMEVPDGCFVSHTVLEIKIPKTYQSNNDSINTAYSRKPVTPFEIHKDSKTQNGTKINTGNVTTRPSYSCSSKTDSRNHRVIKLEHNYSDLNYSNVNKRNNSSDFEESFIITKNNDFSDDEEESCNRDGNVIVDDTIETRGSIKQEITDDTNGPCYKIVKASAEFVAEVCDGIKKEVVHEDDVGSSCCENTKAGAELVEEICDGIKMEVVDDVGSSCHKHLQLDAELVRESCDGVKKESEDDIGSFYYKNTLVDAPDVTQSCIFVENVGESNLNTSTQYNIHVNAQVEGFTQSTNDLAVTADSESSFTIKEENPEIAEESYGRSEKIVNDNVVEFHSNIKEEITDDTEEFCYEFPLYEAADFAEKYENRSENDPFDDVVESDNRGNNMNNLNNMHMNINEAEQFFGVDKNRGNTAIEDRFGHMGGSNQNQQTVDNCRRDRAHRGQNAATGTPSLDLRINKDLQSYLKAIIQIRNGRASSNPELCYGEKACNLDTVNSTDCRRDSSEIRLNKDFQALLRAKIQTRNGKTQPSSSCSSNPELGNKEEICDFNTDDGVETCNLHDSEKEVLNIVSQSCTKSKNETTDDTDKSCNRSDKNNVIISEHSWNKSESQNHSIDLCDTGLSNNCHDVAALCSIIKEKIDDDDDDDDDEFCNRAKKENKDNAQESLVNDNNGANNVLEQWKIGENCVTNDTGFSTTTNERIVEETEESLDICLPRNNIPNEPMEEDENGYDGCRSDTCENTQDMAPPFQNSGLQLTLINQGLQPLKGKSLIEGKSQSLSKEIIVLGIEAAKSTTNLDTNLVVDEDEFLDHEKNDVAKEKSMKSHLETSSSNRKMYRGMYVDELEKLRKEAIEKYTCNLCGKFQKHNYGLQLHLLRHKLYGDEAKQKESLIRKKSLTCKLCGKVQKNDNALKKHLLRHKCRLPRVNEPKCRLPSVNEPKCRLPSVNEPKCRLPSVNEPKCRLPSVNEPKTKPDKNVTCELCRLVLKKKKLKGHLQAHQREKAKFEGALSAMSEDNNVKKKNRVICDLCGMLIQKRCLRRHLWRHQKDNTLKCKVTFSSKETSETCTCKLCGLALKNMESLKAHLRRHKKKNALCSDQCDMKALISDHCNASCTMLEKKTSARVVCEKCGKLIIKKGMKAHLRQHERMKNFDCGHCEATFVSTCLRDAHKKVHADEPNNFTCSLCSESFAEEKYYNRHQEKCSVEALMHTPCKKCPHCDKSFMTQIEIQRHVKFHKECLSYEQKYFCSEPKCDYYSTDRSDCMNHIATHVGVTTEVCDICGHGCRTKASLEIHKRTVHSDERHKFVCELCGKTYRQMPKLKEHMHIHTGEKPHKCHSCHQSFRTKRRLCDHYRSRGKNCNSKCEICNLVFLQKNHYRAHMRTHFENKPFECLACGKLFSKKTSMEAHRKIHSVYTCTFCQKSYLRLHTLCVHLSKQHADKAKEENEKTDTSLDASMSESSPDMEIDDRSQEKDNKKRNREVGARQCKVCYKRFTQMIIFIGHMRVHFDNIPYECGKCGKHFMEKENMEDHIKTHSEFFCTFCYKAFRLLVNLQTHLSKCHAVKGVMDEKGEFNIPQA